MDAFPNRAHSVTKLIIKPPSRPRLEGVHSNWRLVVRGSLARALPVRADKRISSLSLCRGPGGRGHRATHSLSLSPALALYLPHSTPLAPFESLKFKLFFAKLFVIGSPFEATDLTRPTNSIQFDCQRARARETIAGREILVFLVTFLRSRYASCLLAAIKVAPNKVAATCQLLVVLAICGGSCPGGCYLLGRNNLVASFSEWLPIG